MIRRGHFPLGDDDSRSDGRTTYMLRNGRSGSEREEWNMERSEEQLVRIVDDYASELRNLREGTWIADDAIAADMDDIPDMFDQWMYFADPMETVVTIRETYGRPETAHLSDVEMLVSFGGPDIRIVFHENTTATVRGTWGGHVETRVVDMFPMDVVERFAEEYAMTFGAHGGPR